MRRTEFRPPAAGPDRIDTPVRPAPEGAATVPAAAPVDAERLEALRVRLEAVLGRYGRLLVAYSGGVDSAYLLHAALAALGPERVRAVTGVSPSLARRELDAAAALAVRLGAPHQLLETHELDDPNYAANPSNRCYFCKSELFARLGALARAEGFDAVVDGTNLDDLGDHRPGRQAAVEQGVTSPLVEAGLTKADIRALSQAAGLPTWDKPEMPCLSSRIPYGSAVDVDTLRRIECAEDGLRACGVRGGRVRHHGDIARVELPPEDLARLGDASFREALARALRDAGYAYATVDLEGYRRGRLNEVAPADRVAWRRPRSSPEG